MIKSTLFAGSIVIASACACLAADNRIYWTEPYPDYQIQSSSISGDDIQSVHTGLEQPSGLAVDRQNGKIYWSDESNGDGVIKRSDTDGNNVETIVTVGSGDLVSGLALDLVAGKIYWTEYSGERICRANLDGVGGVEPLVTTAELANLSDPVDIVLDTGRNLMYWSDSTGGASHRGSICRAELDGSNPAEVIVNTGMNEAPWGIELDPVGEMLYWAQPTTEKIFKASTDGSGVAVLWETDEKPRPEQLHFDATGKRLYFTDVGYIVEDPMYVENLAIRSINLDGGDEQEIVQLTNDMVRGLSVPNTVPEPSTLALAALGLLGLLLRAWWRRR